MPERSWKDAIITILSESKEPVHYTDITERILTRGLKSTSGATPVATVNAQIAASIKHDGAASPFVRVARGMFTLRLPNGSTAPQPIIEPETEASADVIRAFGIHWQREHVVWRRQPRLFGRQQVAAKSVDFGGQRGVYLLADHHTVVYVGRAIERPLGQRLYEHTLDRLSGRWNRFSWFGFSGVSDAGKLTDEPLTPTLASIVAAFEAIPSRRWSRHRTAVEATTLPASNTSKTLTRSFASRSFRLRCAASNRNFAKHNDKTRNG